MRKIEAHLDRDSRSNTEHGNQVLYAKIDRVLRKKYRTHRELLDALIALNVSINAGFFIPDAMDPNKRSDAIASQDGLPLGWLESSTAPTFIELLTHLKFLEKLREKIDRITRPRH